MYAYLMFSYRVIGDTNHVPKDVFKTFRAYRRRHRDAFIIYVSHVIIFRRDYI